MSSASAGRRLASLLAPVVEQTGLDLEDVVVTLSGSTHRQGRRSEVRVLVDKDGGLRLDDVALVSQAISAALDSAPEADQILGPASYVLEVSSPGVDRPLTEPRHWRRAVGRVVRVTVAGAGELTGRVIAADDSGVRIEVGTGPRRQVRPFTFDQLGPGRVQVEFARPDAAAPADSDDRDDDSGGDSGGDSGDDAGEQEAG